MSLNFNVANVANEKALCWAKDQWGHDDLAPVTKALVHFTMAVGINEITEKNADEFAERVIAVESAIGVTVTDYDETTGWTPRSITVDDVRAHIGLHTNASRLTKTQFRKNLERAAA